MRRAARPHRASVRGVSSRAWSGPLLRVEHPDQVALAAVDLAELDDQRAMGGLVAVGDEEAVQLRQQLDRLAVGAVALEVDTLATADSVSTASSRTRLPAA
jgi:hypothetical protein